MKTKSIVEVLGERLAVVDALGKVKARKPRKPRVQAWSVEARDAKVKQIAQALWAIGEDPDDSYTDDSVCEAVKALRAARDGNEWNGAFPDLINALDFMHGGSLVPRFTWAMENPEDAKREWHDHMAAWASDDDE